MDNASVKDEICNLFKLKYETLYNSPAYNSETLGDQIQGAVSNKCATNCSSIQHLHSINPEMVTRASKKLKADSYDSVYDIQGYNLIHGTPRLYTLLSMCFSSFLSHGLTPSLLNSSYLVPIPKNCRASLSQSENYRAIAINTLFNKLLDYIFIESLQKQLKTSDFQFAYKQNFSTSLCSFLAMEAIHYYNERGSKVLAVFLDASKAFDKVEHVKLFSELLNRGVCPIVVRYLFVSYQMSKLAVKWDNAQSQLFGQGNGVKQGAVLSPLLFAVYIDPLIERIRKSGLGCHIGNTSSNVFGYADDLLLLSSTYSSMEKLQKICEDFGVEFNLTFNPNKSSLLIFNPPGEEVVDRSIMFLGKSIPRNSNEKHLGHVLSTSVNSVNFMDIINDMRVRTTVILKEFGHLNTWAKVNLFKSQCMSLYGCELWDLRDKNFKKICCEWRKCARLILGLSPRTHNSLIPELISSPNVESVIFSRMLSFASKGLSHHVITSISYFAVLFLTLTHLLLTISKQSAMNSILLKTNCARTVEQNLK